jgi:hypothetical protein
MAVYDVGIHHSAIHLNAGIQRIKDGSNFGFGIFKMKLIRFEPQNSQLIVFSVLIAKASHFNIH